jgi:hypothetical protein
MNQMTPTNPVNPMSQPPTPPSQVVKTPTKSWLGWIVAGIIVVLAAVALIFWMNQEAGEPADEVQEVLPGAAQEGTLPEAQEADQMALTPGDSMAEIEEDLNNAELESLDSDLATLNQDASQVP